MGKVHLAFEELSALLDGELGHRDESEARTHLAHCERCSAELAGMSRLESALTATPGLSCAASVELRSALADAELGAAEAGIAQSHLDSCETCQADQVRWSAAETALRAMPAALPSERVDAAMARLVRRPAPRPVLGWLPPAVPGAGLRVAATLAVIVAVLVGLLPGSTGTPEQAAQQGPLSSTALVAGVQLVLYSPTNTYYVLQPSYGAVDAVAADTYQLRTRISVGGRPSALALNEAAARVLVLDSTAKSITEIDANSNAVVSTTEVPISGTPTSMLVEPSSGKIVVASIPDTGGAVSGPIATPRSGGEVAVFDGSTKKLEVLVNVDTAPEQVVTDPRGKTALLVSTTGTTLVDKTYKTLRKLPGGVGAVYGTTGWIAILGAGASGSVLTLVGDGAPAPIQLSGAPKAVTALPDGGFAVLIGSTKSDSRIVVIDAAGAPVGITALEQTGSDLTFDKATRKFAVASNGTIISAPMPLGVAAELPSESPGASVRPTQSTAPSQSPATSASPSAAPSGSPASSPVAAEKPQPTVPKAAVQVGDRLYRLPGSRSAMLLSSTAGNRIWSIDAMGGLDATDLMSGTTYTVAQLPASARIRALAAGPSYVFALDPEAQELYVLSLADEHLSTRSLPAFRNGTDVAATADGQAWISLGDTGLLMSIDPTTARTQLVESKLAKILRLASSGSVVWFTDGESGIGRYDTLRGRLTIVARPGSGSISAMLIDRSGDLWIGTTAGEVISLKGDLATVALSTNGRAIAALALDPSGNVWYLSPGPRGASQFLYAPVTGDGTGRLLPGPATSFAFNSASRAWLADPFGGFYLGVEGP